MNVIFTTIFSFKNVFETGIMLRNEKTLDILFFGAILFNYISNVLLDIKYRVF